MNWSFREKKSQPYAFWSSRQQFCRSWEGRLPLSLVCEASISEAIDDQFIRGGNCDKLSATGIEIGHWIGIPAPIQLLLPKNFPGTGTQSAKAVVVG